jgi:uncharacterized protein YbjT (DUF2867 family)
VNEGAGRILVVGASGSVGRGAVDELRARGARFAAATRDPGRARERLGSGTELVALVAGDPASLSKALGGAGALLLVPPETAGDRKRELARRVAGAAARAGVRRIACVSGLSAIRDEASISRQVERDVEAAGMAWTHLRPNFFMQNYHTVYRESVRRGVIDFFTGAGRTSLVDARDVGAAAAAVLSEPGHEGRAYVLTGAEALDHAEVAAILSRALGRDVRYTARSHEDTRTALRAAGLPEAAIEASLARYREVEAGAFAAVTPALGQLLGRAPRSFASYAREHAQHW